MNRCVQVNQGFSDSISYNEAIRTEIKARDGSGKFKGPLKYLGQAAMADALVDWTWATLEQVSKRFLSRADREVSV